MTYPFAAISQCQCLFPLPLDGATVGWRGDGLTRWQLAFGTLESGRYLTSRPHPGKNQLMRYHKFLRRVSDQKITCPDVPSRPLTIAARDVGHYIVLPNHNVPPRLICVALLAVRNNHSYDCKKEAKLFYLQRRWAVGRKIWRWRLCSI